MSCTVHIYQVVEGPFHKESSKPFWNYNPWRQPQGQVSGRLVPATDDHWTSYLEPNGGLRLILGKGPPTGESLEDILAISIATTIDPNYLFRFYMAAYRTIQYL